VPPEQPEDNSGNIGRDGDPVFEALEEVSRTMGGEHSTEGSVIPTPAEADATVPDPLTQADEALGGDKAEAVLDEAMDMNLRIEMLPPALRASMISLRSQPHLPGGIERYVRTAENAAAVLHVYPTADAISALRSTDGEERDAAMERLERAGYVPGVGAGFHQSCELALWALGPTNE